VWAAQLVGVHVLDHVIIGFDTYYSFADEGLMQRFSKEFGDVFRNPSIP